MALQKKKRRLLKKMSKIDALRVMEFFCVSLFGFVGYLNIIWNWTENVSMVIVFAILFLIVVAIIGLGYKVIKEEYFTKDKKEGKNAQQGQSS